MNRKEGYYWVMEFRGTHYEVALWDGNKWWIPGCGDPYAEQDFFNINETQILPPNN